MYRCSVELSVQYDGQSQSEHASLIDEHDSFNSVAKQIRSFNSVVNTLVRFRVDFVSWICSCLTVFLNIRIRRRVL